MRDLTQLGMSWEAAVHLDLLEEAQRRMEEIQGRFPTSQLAELAIVAGVGRTEADSPLSDAQEHLRHILSDLRAALAQDSPARSVDVLRMQSYQWLQQGRQGAALSAGLSSLRLQDSLQRGVDAALRLTLAELALTLDAPATAQELLSPLPPASQGWRAGLLNARLQLRLGHTAAAQVMLRGCLQHSHDLGILASAKMLQDSLPVPALSAEPQGPAAGR
jgi:hypothetical protein